MYCGAVDLLIVFLLFLLSASTWKTFLCPAAADWCMGFCYASAFLQTMTQVLCTWFVCQMVFLFIRGGGGGNGVRICEYLKVCVSLRGVV